MARREGLGSLALAARGGSGRGREGSVGSLQWGNGWRDYRGHGVAAVTRVKKGRRETGCRRRVTAATEWRR